MIQFDEHIFFKMGGSTSILDTFFYGMIRNDQIETTHCNLSSRQFIATFFRRLVTPKGSEFSKGILQGGPLPVISGVISPINGLING